jgi:NADPH:quinone reductase-like Zn-dependent oxidoreductase
VIATVQGHDVDFVRGLGADQIVDLRTTRFEGVVPPVDAVIDTMGGDIQDRSLAL